MSVTRTSLGSEDSERSLTLAASARPGEHLAHFGLQIGDVIDNRYRVQRLIAAGGMGVVIEVLHMDLGEVRAAKLMRRRLEGDPAGVQRFLREARAAASLSSPHVVRVFDVGRLRDGAPFIVMERLVGEDLRHRVRSQGPLDVARSVGWVVQALRGLALAHETGIVHRDIKPSNLFLCEEGAGRPLVKLLDFGLAKRAVRDTATGEVTLDSDLLGSPLHMAPEQMRDARTVDARADIWAMGTVLYFCLTGDTPFHGSTVADIVASVLTEDPLPPSALAPHVPPALDALVLRCLDKRVDERPPTARDLADRLLASLDARDRAEAEEWAVAPDPRPAPAPAPAEVASPAPRAMSGEERAPIREETLSLTQPAPAPAPDIEQPRPALETASPESESLGAVASEERPRARRTILAFAAISALVLGTIALGVATPRGPGDKGPPTPAPSDAARAEILSRTIPEYTQASLSARLAASGWTVVSATTRTDAESTTLLLVANMGRMVVKLEYGMFADAASARRSAEQLGLAVNRKTPVVVDGSRMLGWDVAGDDAASTEAARGLLGVLTGP